MIFITLDASNNTTMNITINTLEDVKNFVHILMEEENLNFHPDSSFEDYVHNDTGEPYYTEEQAAVRNALINDCFELGNRLGVDTHELMCNVGFELIRMRLRLR